MKIKSSFITTTGLHLLVLSLLCACTQPKDPVSPKDQISNSISSPNQQLAGANLSFDGSEGGFITLTLAETLTSNFQNLNPTATKGVFFGQQKLEEVLNQDDCVGLRIYPGIQINPDESRKSNLVIYGTLADLSDIESGLKLESGTPCPPTCG